ncbi:hypothetical protein [Fimbriiglobus ruber]|uniref:Uncharacterized protein n=1 Tax=Fimbriiglobus ruber TaxID=1908690 RepID=A0A225DD24_9BACT|nr:hypothetical protein [Fimbriiglobus ruber]OWK39460.1 hypothetical protein FRUB_06023 [Fimbriiglobus ruber]
MNDNPAPDKREKLIGRVLSSSVVIEEHLTVGLSKFLEANGLTPEFREVVKEFVGPVIEVLHGLEGDVIDFARSVSKDNVVELTLVDSTKESDWDMER